MGPIQVEGGGTSAFSDMERDPILNYQADNSHVATSLDWLVVPEEKRDRLECSTRPLDYLDKQ